MTGRLDRRTFLRGLGTALALPALDAMAPSAQLLGRLAHAADGPRHPLRLMFIFVPNGMHMPHWTPAREGAGFDFPPILKPLERHRERLLVLSGLTLDAGRAHGDGPGDHARAAATFLTGMHPRKTRGSDIQAGISVDQVAAADLGQGTRFASLELGCEKGAQSGNCDSGYSCAYSSNISWRSPSQPVAKEVSPRRVFERLFGANDGLSPEQRAKRARHRASILDAALGEARELSQQLGTSDRQKLDEYMTAIRDVERRLEGNEDEERRRELDESLNLPRGVPRDLGKHLQLLYELTALAFQADLTRVVTFMAGNAASNRSYRFLGVAEGHHNISHHGKDPKKLKKIARINHFHSEQLAFLLDRLAAIPEGDGSVLDNTLVVYGSAISDGNRHNHEDLPILLAGGGGGSVSPGRHIRYRRDTPLCELYLALLRRAGAHASKFGDGTQPLAGLSG